MISAQEIARFAQELESEKKLLEKELSGLGKKEGPAGDWVPAKAPDEEFGADRNDNADIFEGMQDANATIHELEGRLNNVLHALKKIEDKTFGVCEVSGEDIEIERLSANPAATTCIKHMDVSAH